MVAKCFVDTCQNKRWTPSKFIFHRFPLADPDRLKLWRLALNVDVNTPKEKFINKFICEEHFRPSDYFERMEFPRRIMRRFLRNTAVPSVGIYKPGDPREIVVQLWLNKQKRLMPTDDETSTTANPKTKKNEFTVQMKNEEENKRSYLESILLKSNPQEIAVGPSVTLNVSKVCLLQLFQFCENCGFDCAPRIQEEDEYRFSVIQECKLCDHIKTWRSHPASGSCVDKLLNKDGTSNGNGMSSENKRRCSKASNVNDLSPSNEQTSSKEWNQPVEEVVELEGEEEEEGGSDDDLSSEEEEEQQSSEDEWRPPGGHQDFSAESDSSGGTEAVAQTEETEEDPSQQDEERNEKLVVWCTDCEAESTVTCATRKHKKLLACGVCVVDGEKSVAFDQFYMRFEDMASFEEHVEKEHLTKSKQVLCSECGASFPRKKDHTCEHKLKQFACQDCGKRFSTEHGIKIHRSRHSTDRVYPCKFCLKPFKNRADKLQHEKTHPKQKRCYQCSECPETFSDIIKRNVHLRIHETLRHICFICYKEFTNRHHLERHKLTHTGEKPYVCEVCLRSFAQASHLKSHMRLHTGERPFQCEHCGKMFNHNVSLRSHVQRYHSTECGPQKDGESQEHGAQERTKGQSNDNPAGKRKKRYGSMTRMIGRPKKKRMDNDEGVDSGKSFGMELGESQERNQGPEVVEKDQMKANTPSGEEGAGRQSCSGPSGSAVEGGDRQDLNMGTVMRDLISFDKCPTEGIDFSSGFPRF